MSTSNLTFVSYQPHKNNLVVQAIPNVNQPKPAVIDFVSIHALKAIHALVQLNVSPKTTELNVLALLDWSEIHLEIVIKNFQHHRNAQSTPNVQLIPLASIENALIRALRIIHVQEMQNVVSHRIVHYASVHKDGAAIQRYNVINVSQNIRKRIRSLFVKKEALVGP